MTNFLGINDFQPRNLEAPRTTELLPEQIRSTATKFTQLLTEYYKFMNINSWTTSATTFSTTTVIGSGSSGSGPTNVIYSILSELDILQINSAFLSHLQNTVAPYVPIPNYMISASSAAYNVTPFYKYLTQDQIAAQRALLYQKIVKYFYNTRGSRNSVTSFFRIFFNDAGSVYDQNDTTPATITALIQPWLTGSGVSLGATTVSAGAIVNGQTPIQAWLPFTYVLSTAIAQATFDPSYRALVHPVGFKYFVAPTQGAGGVYVSDSRMDNARTDYQQSLWFHDTTRISEFINFVESDANAIYTDAYQDTLNYTFADWSNIGSILKISAIGFLAITAYWNNYLTVNGLANSTLGPGQTVVDISSASAIFTGSTIAVSSFVSISKTILSASGTSLVYLAPDPSVIPGLFVSTSSTGSAITFSSNTYITSTSIMATTVSSFSPTPMGSPLNLGAYGGYSSIVPGVSSLPLSYGFTASSIPVGVGITGTVIPANTTVTGVVTLPVVTLSTTVIDKFGGINNFTSNSNTYFAPGWYRVFYISGVDAYSNSNPWYGTTGTVYYNNGANYGTTVQTYQVGTGGTGPAAQVSVGQTLDFYHTGGTIGMQFPDNFYPDNVDYTLTYGLTSVSYITLSSAPSGTPGVSLYSSVAVINSGSNTVSSLTTVSGQPIVAGQAIFGYGITPGTYVTSVSGTSVTLSQPTFVPTSGITLNSPYYFFTERFNFVNGQASISSAVFGSTTSQNVVFSAQVITLSNAIIGNVNLTDSLTFSS